MKYAPLLLVGLALVLATACRSRPVFGQPSAFRERQELFQSIDRQMTKDEVFQLLGPPDLVEENGRHHWSIVRRKREAELIVWFTSTGAIGEISRSTVHF